MDASCKNSDDVAANGISFCLDGVVGDVDSLHVEIKKVVGVNFLGIYDRLVPKMI